MLGARIDRMTIAFRLGTIGALALVLAALPAGLFVWTSQKEIATAELEAQGVRTVRALLQAVQHVQQHRGLAALALAGDGAAGARREAKQTEVEQALREAEASMADALPELRRALEDWRRLRAQAGGGTQKGPEFFEAHTQLVARLLDALDAAADRYGLWLDPHYANYHLIVGLLDRLPRLAEQLGQLRALGARHLQERRIAPVERVAIAAVAQRARDEQAGVARALGKSLAADEALRGALAAAAKAASDAALGAVGLASRQVIEAESPAGSATEYFAALTAAIDTQYRLLDAGAAALERTLAGDAAARSRMQYGLLALLALLTAGGMALGAMFARSIARTLGGEPAYAVSVARRIAGGDLSEEIRVARGGEASLLGSMRHMQDALRRLIAETRTSAQRLATASTDLSSTSSQVAVASSQQNEAASAMAASVEQMTVSIGQVSEHATSALKVSRAAGKALGQSRQAVEATSGEMGQMAETTAELIAIIENLSERSAGISKIVHVIREIADQTNLLALNAAIEAARAGEQGRGFSVVADEVRRLAERTTQSTQEIGEMVVAIQKETATAVASVECWSERVAEGAKRARTAGECMGRLNQDADKVGASVGEIASALAEQSSASSQIAQSVERIAQMSEENSAAVGAMAGAAQDLDRLANSLRNLVATFRLEPRGA